MRQYPTHMYEPAWGDNDHSPEIRLLYMLMKRKVRLAVSYVGEAEVIEKLARGVSHYNALASNFATIDGRTVCVFEADMDGCPGYLHHEEDWVNLVQNGLTDAAVEIL